MEQGLQAKHWINDKYGDKHDDSVSDLIKSIRGSDTDATVYWMARMIEAGEDMKFVARRLVISAAEDVGLADPQALSVAVAAQQAAHFVGPPEAVLPPSEAPVSLARAPKSTTAMRAFHTAAEDLRGARTRPRPSPPRHPRDPPVRATLA